MATTSTHSRRPLVLLSLVVLLIGAAVFPSIPQARAASGAPYLGLTAMGMPASPQPFYPSTGYAVSMYEQAPMQINTSATGQLLTPNTLADHTATCGAPTPDNQVATAGTSHTTTTFDNSLYVCHDHVMTSLNGAGYDTATIMPDAVADWSGGATTVIQWRVSTFTASDRDWWNVYLTPILGQLSLPASSQGEQINGQPKTAVHLQLCSLGERGLIGQHGVCAEVINNGKVISLPLPSKSEESVLTPSRATRTLYELDISAGHIRVWLPESGLVFVDSNVSVPFTQGVMELSHESYDPAKGDACGPPATEKALGGPCQPVTWHWSDISISNAIHFDISHPSARFLSAGHASTQFPAPVVAGSYLRFEAVAALGLSVSFDGGATYTKATATPSELDNGGGCSLAQYLMPIPAGATSMMVKAANNCFGDAWVARDMVVLGPIGGGVIQPPTPTPTPTQPPSPTPTPTQGPQPINLDNTPCMITNAQGQMVNGRCTGTFTPDQ